MIKLRIRNKNGDVLYERDDEYYVRLNSEDFAYISDALDDVGSDVVYVDIDCDVDDNPFMVYSYHSVMRGGKTVIENKIRKVLKEYERQLSALPVQHPAEHTASHMREVGSHDEDDGHDSHDEDDGHDEDDSHDNYDDYDSHDDYDDYDGRIFSLSDMGLPDHRFEEELRKDILATLPGSYVGCGKHDECKRQSERESDSEQDTEKDVRTSEDSEHTQLLKDFISYLNTYTSWASLLDDLGFYDESKDSQELIEKFYRTRAIENAITQNIRDYYERHERNLRQPWKR